VAWWRFRYVEDDEKLCKFLASLQLLPRLPRLLIIDDISSFVGDKDPKRIAKVMAFIKEAATYAATKVYARRHLDVNVDGALLTRPLHRRDFVLLASESLDVEANPRSLQVYQRWFDMMMLVRGSSPPAL
jgi:hypothetical protein